ncbi:MAG: hypothetical protein P1U86_20060 [Verrucomicrobiales bacterium]|nr:hypothetical protein [Verrucomicrobiales bacterium]
MILQFGAGNFLRGFTDLFAGELNPPLEITVVQSTGRERADALNAAGGNYHVAIRGFCDGGIIDETQSVTSIKKALHAGTQWDEILEIAASKKLTTILSNTTEAGLALDERDQSEEPSPPFSFPAKLLTVLRHHFEAGGNSLWILPCELVESNADLLRDLVLEQAAYWGLDTDLTDWIEVECRWVNSLVDRIVPGRPDQHPLLEEDPLLISAEPFAFWAVDTYDPEFPFSAHPAVVTTGDLLPYTLRKVRILNGAHSALVAKSKGTDLTTVREAIEDPEVGEWLSRVLFEEIVPTIEGRCEDPESFARETLDRFRNPFLNHELSAIALNHEAKWNVRIEPTIQEFEAKFGKAPALLSALS